METTQHDTVDLEYLEVALAETFSKPGTADVTPADRAKLAGLLKHYRGMTHPFRVCKRDQMKHGLSEDHAERRCAVIKDLIEGNTKWREGGNKKANLSEEELATYALDADEDFFAWLSETDAEAMIREAEEEQEKVGIVRTLSRFLGLSDGADTQEADPDPDPLEEVEEEVAASSVAKSAVNLSYQLPYDLTEPEKISRRLWRKHILPLGKKINYTTPAGKSLVLDFSRDTLQKMVDNFKAGAFDKVYFTARHSRESRDVGGVVRDIVLRDDGLYADIETSEEGEKLIKNSLGEIGTSVSYDPEYTRKADSRYFGPSLQHIAAVPTPHVPGLGAWEAIQMSEEAEAKVVDLTEAEYAAPDPVPRKESGPMETQTNEETREVEMEGQQVDLAAKLAALESALNEERTKREAVELDARRANDSLREQATNAMFNRMVAEGKTTPPKAEAGKVMLAALSASDSDVIELSADGASVKDDEVGKAMMELLAPGAVPETGERGATDLESRDDMDEETAIHLEVQQYRAEHPGVEYPQALEVIMAKREVR